MTKHFLVSTAAAALIAGTGFAYAQGMSQGASGGSAASQSATVDVRLGRSERAIFKFRHAGEADGLLRKDTS